MRMSSQGPWIGMVGHQGVALFERIWRCALEKVSLEVGFEVSRAQGRPSVSLFFSLYYPKLLLQHLVSLCCHALCHDNGPNH